MSELTLEAIKKMMEDMCEQSEKRMAEMINKIAPTSSKPLDSSPTLDENGIPIPGEHHEGSHSSEGSKTNEFGHTYNISPNIQHPHVNNLGNPPLVDRSRFTNWKHAMKSYV